jgi:hypothetical protein
MVNFFRFENSDAKKHFFILSVTAGVFFVMVFFAARIKQNVNSSPEPYCLKGQLCMMMTRYFSK